VKSSVKRERRKLADQVDNVRSKSVAGKKKKKKSSRGAATPATPAVPRAETSAPRVLAKAKSRVVKAVPRTHAADETAASRAKVARHAKRRPARGRRVVPGALLERLSQAIPRPHVELAFEHPWQLLIAVILSAQSTDRRVNQVTPALFGRWPTPRALAAAVPAQVEEMIKSTGFFRNKTKAILGASAMLVDRFEGQVPRGMEEMLALPGVARKTANVVLGAAYRIAPGIVVDTHAARVAQRLGLTAEADPAKIERELCALFPESEWLRLGLRFVLHGRYVCTARAPACSSCPLNEACPARLEPGLGPWRERAAREAAEMEARAAGFVRI
jgi:endonuclease-3